MKKDEALKQLCKMQGEIAGRLGLDSLCLCDDTEGKPKDGEVPDKVIEEMWRRLTEPRVLCVICGELVPTRFVTERILPEGKQCLCCMMGEKATNAPVRKEQSDGLRGEDEGPGGEVEGRD